MNAFNPAVRLFSNSNETVEANRRRRGSGSGPSGRAEMPSRPSSGSGGGGTRPPSSRPPSSGGSRKGGMSIGGILIIIVLYFLFQLFSGGGGEEQSSSQDNPSSGAQPVLNTPLSVSPTRVPTRKPSSGASSSQTWTVMLYQDADDAVLEQDIMIDLNEAERVGSSAQVTIVSQIDRYSGAYSGDGNWTGTRRYFLTQDDDLNRLNSEMVGDLGEVNMADPQTLVDFAVWAMTAYPADRYVLILSDHGMGWPGGWTDPKPAMSSNANVPFAQAMNDNMLMTSDLDRALGQILQQTGVQRFELVGLDACLMSQLEVYSALAPHARYVVSSQETEPALGWAYSSFLQSLEADPGMDGAELGRQIVSSYIVDDERIVDASARAEFLRQGSPYGRPADVDPARLSNQLGRAVTLSAADMDALPDLMNALNQLSYALMDEKPAVVARARTYAQSFESIFGKQVPPSYIDLGNFAQLIQKESNQGAVYQAADALLAQIQRVVVAEKHGPQKPGATGISIYFPNSSLYRNAAAGPSSYTKMVDRFTQDSLWDDFLAFHYTGETFELNSTRSVVPASGAAVRSPGGADFDVSALQLSARQANYDQPISMQASLTGSNIGYVYLFVGYFDPASDSILVADKDYLESPQTRQVGELYYPNWSEENSFDLKYTWTPSVFAIDDGQQTVTALLRPERYGASSAEAVYSTDGIYRFADSGETRNARMFFADGQLQSVFAFTGSDETGAPREIIPQSGDQITLIQTWLEPDGSGGYRAVTENGETLTFGSQPFTWKELYAAVGDYVVGFVVSDLDGNEKTAFGQVTIR